MKTFLRNIKINDSLYNHTHVLCNECKNHCTTKNIYVEKIICINNFTIASKRPFNCKNKNLIIFEILHNIKSIFIHIENSFEQNSNIWLENSKLLLFDKFNKKNFQESLEKLNKTGYKIIYKPIQHASTNFKPHIYNIYNNNYKVYGDFYPTFKDKYLCHYINPNA